MKVLVSFSDHFDGQIADAAWLIESQSNRGWLKGHWSLLDPNSATFRSDADVSDILDSVFEHHPNWTEIVVQHVMLTPDIEASFGPGTILSRTTDGFTVNRL
ncbi:hypothetical protein ACOYW6_12890 [Parablastomonas sp. CN1-191]|uniref:hypothetical protein n=1 Tax=Parablastomonas sp. CN1-191 TaxID=3400908 RepID=UPI003BF7B251